MEILKPECRREIRCTGRVAGECPREQTIVKKDLETEGNGRTALCMRGPHSDTVEGGLPGCADRGRPVPTPTFA